jgi:hypothetical protein
VNHLDSCIETSAGSKAVSEPLRKKDQGSSNDVCIRKHSWMDWEFRGYAFEQFAEILTGRTNASSSLLLFNLISAYNLKVRRSFARPCARLPLFPLRAFVQRNSSTHQGSLVVRRVEPTPTEPPSSSSSSSSSTINRFRRARFRQQNAYSGGMQLALRHNSASHGRLRTLDRSSGCLTPFAPASRPSTSSKSIASGATVKPVTRTARFGSWSLQSASFQ